MEQDQKDAHGWTPLLWALRVTGRWGAETGEKRAIVQDLLDHGARRLVRGQGVDRTWTPMKLAKYCNLGQDVIEVLTPTPGDLDRMSDEDREWDWKSGGGKRGVVYSSDDEVYCDHCLLASTPSFLFLFKLGWGRGWLGILVPTDALTYGIGVPWFPLRLHK